MSAPTWYISCLAKALRKSTDGSTWQNANPAPETLRGTKISPEVPHSSFQIALIIKRQLNHTRQQSFEMTCYIPHKPVGSHY